MKSALIVIDVQNFFMNEHTVRVPLLIARHLKDSSYDAIAFTRFINSESSSFYKIFGWTKCMDSPYTDLCDELKPWVKPNNVFTKGGFSAFKSPKLLAYLYSNGIQEVVLCGTDTEACVLASALEAFELGFHVRVLHELCGSTNGREYDRYGRAILQRNLETPPSQ